MSDTIKAGLHSNDQDSILDALTDAGKTGRRDLRAARIEFRRLESGADRLLLVEVPGGLTLSFGAGLPPGYRPAAKRREPRPAPVRPA